MNAEIITIGDELLIGQVVDTNSAWIAQQLNDIGISVAQITSISDSETHILTTLQEATSRADVILITGGLGPTKDDITKTTLCNYFNTHLVFNAEAYKTVERIFAARNMPVSNTNRQQAMLPACCTMIPNVNGTAPAMKFEKEGKIYISMPGVPFEMKEIMQNHVIPMLQVLSDTCIIHRTILVEGISESNLSDLIEPWETKLPSHLKLAYLPNSGLIRLRITAKGYNKAILEKDVADAENKLIPYIKKYMYGHDEESLEYIIGKILREQHLTLATAESCTGGNIAHLITGVAGSSAYFKGSVVAYANEIKENILHVPHDIIDKHGAVSEEVVRCMSENIKSLFHTDYAIAVSGIAGPASDDTQKPVGGTWIALATPAETLTAYFLFGKKRETNISRATNAALHMLYNHLVNKF